MSQQMIITVSKYIMIKRSYQVFQRPFFILRDSILYVSHSCEWEKNTTNRSISLPLHHINTAVPRAIVPFDGGSLVKNSRHLGETHVRMIVYPHHQWKDRENIATKFRISNTKTRVMYSLKSCLVVSYTYIHFFVHQCWLAWESKLNNFLSAFLILTLTSLCWVVIFILLSEVCEHKSNFLFWVTLSLDSMTCTVFQSMEYQFISAWNNWE